MRGLVGEAFVAIWHDIVAEGQPEFQAWHTREHMPERLAVPGFLRGRRYRAADGAPEYFNLYEVETAAVLTSGEYLARLNNPTPWTQRALPHFRNVSRSLCRLGASVGRAQGGLMLTASFEVIPGAEDALAHFLADQVLPKIFDRSGILGVHFGIADRPSSEIVTTERKARGDLTRVPGWVFLLEGVSESAVLEAGGDLAAIEARGAQGPVARTVYRLECSLARAGSIG